MQTVSRSTVILEPYANAQYSTWAFIREFLKPTSGAGLILHRAVHNFCTSQKAVSHASQQSVIGGAHRGGKQIVYRSGSFANIQ
jgi:hypothetical protein